MLSLLCAAQRYEWGRKGQAGQVAQLHAANSGVDIDAATPYAELWAGTHPNGPSLIKVQQEGAEQLSLAQYVRDHPHSLGPAVLQRWGAGLPFLLKVLSVDKALSIQAHPDLALAKELNAARPDIYRDPNHKPEMALALQPFEALCGFVASSELRQRLRTVPELREAAGEGPAQAFMAATERGDAEKHALKAVFTSLMTQEKEIVARALANLISRLQRDAQDRPLTDVEQLVMRLDQQYPGGDVGVFAAYFLNHFTLQPGEGVYLAANEPHAYLSGECAEVMATSDNVVRAGLTPKYRDTDILCAMLTYEQGMPDILRGEKVDERTVRYSPASDEFELDVISVGEGVTHQLLPCAGPSLLLLYKGSGSATCKLQDSSDVQTGTVKRGDVLFVPAYSTLTVTAAEGLQAFRAGCSNRIL
eukprot:jgi/Chlat1/2623/Chrsp178S02473